MSLLLQVYFFPLDGAFACLLDSIPQLPLEHISVAVEMDGRGV